MNEQEKDFDPQIENSLRLLKNIPPRDPSVASRARQIYLAQANALSREMARQPTASPRGWRSLLPRKILLATSLASLVLLFLLGGTGISVYAAQDSLPGGTLYPVKLLSEDAQIALAFQTENKLSLYLAFADRRVEEVRALNNQGRVPTDTLADRLRQELNSALVLAANMPEEDEGRALTRMQANVRRQQEKMGEVASHVAVPAKPVLARVQSALADHLTLVELGLTDPPGLQQHLRGRGNSFTPPGQEKHGTGNPPGQDRRPPMPPGKEQHTLTPSAPEHRTTTPTTPGRQPALTPTPKALGGGKGK